ncbi:MAG: hypothetical protein ACRELB_04715 [Polyangiaceae bacterium]
MRPESGLVVIFACGYAAVLAASCKGASSGGPSDAGFESGAGDDGSEPAICEQFSAAGDPCPTPSPVRCFPECDSGGCYCRSGGGGGPPRWVCETDLSCVPDCAPLDDACSPPTPGDDGPGDETGDAAVPGDGGDSETGAADSGDAGDGSAPVDGSGTSDGGDAGGSG